MTTRKKAVFAPVLTVTGTLALAFMSANCGSDGEQLGTDSGPFIAGSCVYQSSESPSERCLQFEGRSWTPSDMSDKCDQLGGSLNAESACKPIDHLGRCDVEEQAEQRSGEFVYSLDPADCDGEANRCNTRQSATWLPTPICRNDGPGFGGSVFVPPTLRCQDPIAGEPPGKGPDGQVCTWQSISGCTEEGRQFVDYASCEIVLTQRPYWPGDPADDADAEDPRMEDPEYVKELNWVRSQVEASACMCCHSSVHAPGAPSNWYVEAPGNWMNTLWPSGLALGANWITSEAFGAYDPKDNNGFHRDTTGFPSTDPERMTSFFERELAHRGLSKKDFADATPFGGPMYGQLIFEPEACEDGEGVDAEGHVNWTGGDARYIYVLDEGSANPTVPPNLDLPDGTIWRLDVPASGEALESGTIRYGEVPTGRVQRFPAEGSPKALTKGTTYYLYVTRDIGIPATRCTFTY